MGVAEQPVEPLACGRDVSNLRLAHEGLCDRLLVALCVEPWAARLGSPIRERAFAAGP